MSRFGGFVWVSLDDNPIDLEEWAASRSQCLRKSLEAEPLEVFHSSGKAIVPTNYKLWHDTNSEFYHDFMHYHNRVTRLQRRLLRAQERGVLSTRQRRGRHVRR